MDPLQLQMRGAAFSDPWAMRGAAYPLSASFVASAVRSDFSLRTKKRGRRRVS